MDTKIAAKLSYNDWVKEEAAALNSDGCSFVSELFHWCCLEHDLAYRLGKDPREAYEKYCSPSYVGNPWVFASPISRSEADAGFRRCIQSRSKLGKWSPVGWIRYLGVRIGGHFIWKH